MANQKLGLGLRKVRIREGLTQVDLANKIDTTQGYVNQMELGNVSLKKFSEILSLLGYKFEINIAKIEKLEEVHI
jgi:predicted transcriptional regulator